MKQVFLNKDLEKLKKELNIKDSPWEWDIFYIQKTIKYIKYIKWIPWIKMIWIWNSISMNSWSKESDIDLYIVTNKNRLWLVRIITTIIFQILWVRKTKTKHAWRFCLSFFSTIKWMDFSSFAINNDIYLYFWIIYFKPILSFNDTYENFIKTNSSWADFNNYKKDLENNKNFIVYKWNKKDKKSTILDSLNKALKYFFQKRSLKSYKKIWKPYWIIISDDLLKFHNWDIRKNLKTKLIKSS